MSLSLYNLTEQALELQLMLETGEISEEVYNDTLEGLDIGTKIENICKVIKNLTAQAEMYKAEKDRLAERQKTAENGIKRLKGNLLNYMLQTNQNKIQKGIFSVRVRNSEKVKVTDITKIPKEYLIPQDPKVDILGLKKTIKEGEEIDGIDLEQCSQVVIR